MTKWYLASQNQNHDFEMNEEILWSPQVSRNNGTIHSYKLMSQIKKGDIIINTYDRCIKGYSRAIEDSTSHNTPNRQEYLGTYGNIPGWLVKLDIKLFNVSIDNKSEREFFANEDNRLDKYDAFNDNGTLNQGYLFELSDEEIDYIKALLKV